MPTVPQKNQRLEQASSQVLEASAAGFLAVTCNARSPTWVNGNCDTCLGISRVHINIINHGYQSSRDPAFQPSNPSWLKGVHAIIQRLEQASSPLSEAAAAGFLAGTCNARSPTWVHGNCDMFGDSGKAHQHHSYS